MSTLSLFAAGWLLIIAAACVGVRAWRIDRDLRHLLPTLIERRWREAILQREEASPWHWNAELLIPARWRRQLHSERGAALLDRMFHLVALTWILTIAGVTLMGVSIDLAIAPGVR